MIIGIDGNEANVVWRVGVGECAFELLKQFSRSKIRDLKFAIYLKDKPREEMPKQRDGWNYRIVQPRKLWTQIALPFDLYTHFPKPDVFFTPTHYAPRFSPVPTVVSIMDLSFLYFPEMFKKSDLYQLRNWTAYSAKHAARVLTISSASKDDIIKAYGIPADMVMVTYPGVKLPPKARFAARRAKLATGGKTQMSKVKTTRLAEALAKRASQNSKVLKEKYGIDREYILFVGTLQPRKNIARLIEAFSKITPRSPSLVIVGKKGWLYEEILEAPKRFGVEDHVKFLEFVSDEDLPVLYQNALCFVLPSLYEGFGLPVLEAMTNGCPVITSNVSSLPEAGGDAALYVDPKNVDDIASKLQDLIEDENLRRQLIEKGYKQVRKFSWEKTARETLKVLTQVASTK